MTIKDKEGKTLFEMDDFTLFMISCVIAFMVVGHC